MNARSSALVNVTRARRAREDPLSFTLSGMCLTVPSVLNGHRGERAVFPPPNTYYGVHLMAKGPSISQIQHSASTYMTKVRSFTAPRTLRLICSQLLMANKRSHRSSCLPLASMFAWLFRHLAASNSEPAGSAAAIEKRRNDSKIGVPLGTIQIQPSGSLAAPTPEDSMQPLL
jgi:hypothetical protein